MTKALFKILNDPACMFVDKYFNDFPEDSDERKLLEIFAYGTWSDYVSIASSLPNDLQFSPTSSAANKLKKLTIMTICNGKYNVPYDLIKPQIEMDNEFEIESLIIDLLSSDLLIAKIDETHHSLICERVASRCIRNDPTAFDNVIDKISQLRENITTAIRET